MAVEERRQVAAEIGVAEQDRARRRRPLGQRQRLPFSAVREAENPRAGCRRDVAGRIAGPVVGDDHLCVGKLPLQFGDGRPDPRRLVARGDRTVSAVQPLGAGSGSIGGRIPSSAVSRMP